MSPKHDEKKGTNNFCNSHPNLSKQPTTPTHQPDHSPITRRRLSMTASSHDEREASKRLLLDFSKNFGITEEVVFLLADFNGIAAPSGEQDTVARLYRHWGDLSLLVSRTGTHSNDGRFGKGVVRRARGQENTRSGFCFGFEPLYEDAVE